jgi:hypothetical protein
MDPLFTQRKATKSPTNGEQKPNPHEREHERKHYTNEGSEFLSDNLRMTEQPFMGVEQSIAVGSPEDLL